MANCLKHKGVQKIKIKTYDNPGWGIAIYSNDILSQAHEVIAKKYISEEDWFSQVVDGNKLWIVGDNLKLAMITRVALAQLQIAETLYIHELFRALDRLVMWYTYQCDGDWEHTFGASGEISDNEHVYLEIDMAETECEDQPFDSTSVMEGKCYVANNKFVIECAFSELAYCLNVFIDWANACIDAYYLDVEIE